MSELRTGGRRLLAIGLATGLLAGCGGGGSDLGGLAQVPELQIGSRSTLRDTTPPTRRADAVTRPVAQVDRLETGTTRRGVLLTAFGATSATGWFQPRLRPLRDGALAPDGFLEFEFVAAPPELNGAAPGGPGTPAQRAIRADRPLDEDDLAGAVGLRVFAQSGAVATRLDRDAAAPSGTGARATPAAAGASSQGPQVGPTN